MLATFFYLGLSLFTILLLCIFKARGRYSFWVISIPTLVGIVIVLADQFHDVGEFGNDSSDRPFWLKVWFVPQVITLVLVLLWKPFGHYFEEKDS